MPSLQREGSKVTVFLGFGVSKLWRSLITASPFLVGSQEDAVLALQEN